MKRTALALKLIFALLVSAIAGAFFVKYTGANPYMPGGETAPPTGTKPPTITIRSPEDKTYDAGNILLSFTVTVGDTQPIPNGVYTSAVNTRISEVHYEADWLGQNVTVYLPATDKYGSYLDNGAYTRSSVEFSGDLTDIPQGRHTIIVHVTESGVYEGGLISGGPYVYQNRFNIRQNWMVSFTVGSAATEIIVKRLEVTWLSVENSTYHESDVPVDFTLSEPASHITYSLDGQDNVTISGNATLTGLCNGPHNVTIYAMDSAGNISVSETMVFTVAEELKLQPEPDPFPTTLVLIASGASIVLVGACLLVYFKKRKHPTKEVL